MRRTFMIVSLGLGLPACGPVVDPPVDQGGSSGTTEPPATSEASSADATATSLGSSTGTSPATSEGSGDASSSGGTDELVPPESVITTVTCNEDGTLSLVLEVILPGDAEACVPSADIEAHEVLYVSIPMWDGLPGTYEVGRGAPAIAVHGLDSVEGTMTLEVWAPTHPSLATIDLGEGLAGTLDLEACAVTNEAPCPRGG